MPTHGLRQRIVITLQMTTDEEFLPLNTKGLADSAAYLIREAHNMTDHAGIQVTSAYRMSSTRYRQR